MRRLKQLALAAAVAALLAGSLSAQQRFRRGGFRGQLRMATPQSFDGSFNFCRVMFRFHPYGHGGGWAVDYPRADENLSIRLSELTKTPVSHDASGEPNYVVLRLTDPELFRCPFIMMTEVGAAYFDDEEAAKLREYLLKGGFLWADDFWGSYAWSIWAGELAKVLPSHEYPIVDLPPDHPVFRTLFVVNRLPQIPSINFWMGSGGGTSEQGSDSAQPHARGIADPHGRLMVLITHNTDFGDSWEREGDDPNYFHTFSLDGYAVGIDVLLYAMTH
ncbi:MAG: DUF4159 domain-containing protein [Acidobacteria bacterium]|nr:DUF4159 domain-containing protein [Acidobacteriota bacterium]